MKTISPLLLLAVFCALSGGTADAQNRAPIIEETGEEIIATFQEKHPEMYARGKCVSGDFQEEAGAS